MKIVYIGAGFVGTPSAAVTAFKCPQHQVYILDVNDQRIKAWNSLTDLPFYEPGLEKILKQIINVNLFFVTDKSVLADCDMVFICVNVPVQPAHFKNGTHHEHEINAKNDQTVNFQYFDSCLNDIKNLCSKTKTVTVVQKSTVPVNSMDRFKKILDASQTNFDILSNPEFLAESTAIDDLIYPNRVIIGCFQHCSGSTKKEAMEKLGKLYENWVDPGIILYMSSASAELCKLASNAFLAQRLSSINSLIGVSEKTNADITDVQRGISFDKRIGKHYLKSSYGYGGSCLEKDVNMLSIVLQNNDEMTSFSYWKSVIDMNHSTVNGFAEKIIKYCTGSEYKSSIAFFGITFKENTSDTRNSPAVSIVKRLLDKLPNNINIYDELNCFDCVKKEFSSSLDRLGFFSCPYKAVENTGIVVIGVNSNKFKTFDYSAIKKSMTRPFLVFDGKFCLDPDQLLSNGIMLFNFGRAN